MTEPKKADFFPYIVTFLDPDQCELRWRPKQPDGGLESAMVPAYQRGGIHGDFQQLNENKVEFELFIPFSAIRAVETRSSFEKRGRASRGEE